MIAVRARPWRRHRVLVAVATTVALVAVATGVAPRVARAASTIYVANGGNDANPGTSSAPKQTVAAAVKVAKTGDTVLLRAGIYSESVQVYMKAITIASAPGERAILDGSKTVSGWSSSGGDWTASWSTRFAHHTGEPVDPGHPVAGLPDQLFVDGTQLAQVTSRTAVVPGTFYFDEAGSKLWVGSDPNGHSLMASYLPWAIYLNKASGSTLRNITVRRYATPTANMAAVRAYSDNLTLSGLQIENNAYSGISVMGNNISLTGSIVKDNGFIGVHGDHATNFILENTGVIRNNRELFDSSFAGSGVKFTDSSDLQFRDNYIASNQGPGLWVDLGTANITMTGNLVEENLRSGIQLEVSGQITVANNVSLNNGEAGYWILESNDISLWNNAGFGNLRDIWAEDGPRTSSTANSTVRWDLHNVTIRNNIVGGGHVGAQALVNADDWKEIRSASAMMVTSDFNAFWLPASSPTKSIVRWARWSTNLAVSSTLPTHRSATGQDDSSIMSTSGTNPYSINPGAYDYRMPSSVGARGAVLTGAVAKSLGFPAGAAVTIGPLSASHVITVPNYVVPG